MAADSAATVTLCVTAPTSSEMLRTTDSDTSIFTPEIVNMAKPVF